MLDRRGFIEAGLAASIAVALGASEARRVNGEDAAAHPALYAAVLDRRFPESREFGRALERLGVGTRVIEGDVTKLWYQELHRRWQQGAAVIAGLTTYGPLFCLERLSWDHRLRLVYRGTHARLADGRIEHRVCGATRSFSVVHEGADSLARWPAQVAEALARSDVRDRTAAWRAVRLGQEDRYLSPPLPRQAAALSEPLYSWLIA